MSSARLSLRGFTLVEILVALAISLVLLGLVIVGYRKFLERRNLSLVTSELKSQLRLVRSKAMSGEKPSADCQVLNGYRVLEEGGTLAYLPICSGVDYQQGKETISITNDFDEIDIISVDSFVFSALDGSLEEGVVTVEVNYGGTTGQLEIFPSGEIQEVEGGVLTPTEEVSQ